MLDQSVQRFAPEGTAGYDADGNLARQGNIHHQLLERLKSHSFFSQPLPKSTGPEVFHLDWALSVAEAVGISLQELPLPDLLATLTELSASTLAESIRKALPQASGFEAYGSGGGMHNQTLIRRIGHHLGLDGPLPGIEKLGGNADFKEVALFGLLGYFRQHRIRLPLFHDQAHVLMGKLSEA
jgi:anhydro-N-acetylmuramic acid kinase